MLHDDIMMSRITGPRKHDDVLKHLLNICRFIMFKCEVMTIVEYFIHVQKNMHAQRNS